MTRSFSVEFTVPVESYTRYLRLLLGTETPGNLEPATSAWESEGGALAREFTHSFEPKA